jgi:hypothetical protein
MSIEIKELNIKSEISSSDNYNSQDKLMEIENRILHKVRQELSDLKRSRNTSNNER